MTRPLFHHPDVSLTVLRRTVSAELIDLTGLLAEVLSTRGRALLWNRSLSTRTSYYQAVYRLRKAGLIAYRQTGGRAPEIKLTPTGQARASASIVPERFWNQQWNGIWYLLMYDIPEAQRRYRSSLRCFLAHLRLGCLQKSVWISARDIRPLFHDLQETAAIHDYAYLFEAQTVLGQQGAEVTAQAWDFDRLGETHARYIEEVEKRMMNKPLDKGLGETLTIMRHELADYVEAMRWDPLLPSMLWPPGYKGPKVIAVFRQRIRQLAAKAMYH